MKFWPTLAETDESIGAPFKLLPDLLRIEEVFQ